MASKKLAATIIVGGAISNTLGQAFNGVKGRINDLAVDVASLTRRQQLLGKSIQEFGRAGKDVSGLRTRYAAVTAEIDKQTAALKRLREQEETRMKLRDMGAKAGVGAAITGALGLKLASEVNEQVTNFNGWEKELTLIGNTADLTSGQVKDLGESIRRSSRSTGQDIDNTTKGIGFLVAAGMEVGTAQQTINQVGKAATASGGEIEDLSKAAFTLNDTLNIKPGEQMAYALDIMAKAGKDGNVELRDMAKLVPALSASMKSLKMDGPEAIASMAAALQIARKGTDTADKAGTNMDNFLGKMMSPETLKKASKNFGVDFYKVISDAQKKGQNPFEVAMEKIIKMTKNGDQKLIGDLFQDMEVQKFIRPMIQQWGEYKRIKASALESKGTLDRDFEKVMATGAQQTAMFKAATDDLSKSFGEAMAPALAQIGAALTPIIQDVADFVRENKSLVSSVVIGAGAFLGLTTAIGATVAAVGLAAVGIGLIGIPIVAVTGALGLLAAAGTMVYIRWGEMKEGLIAIWDTIKEAIENRVNAIAKKFEWVYSKYTAIKNFLGETVDAAGKFISDREKENTLNEEHQKFMNSYGVDGVPEMPMMATRYNQAPAQEPTQVSITVQQQPGESGEALAQRTAEIIEQKNRSRARGSMSDGANN